MPITQQHLADRLGVSVATVSRALKNDPAIKLETRGRVLDAAASLGYSPSRTLGAANDSGRTTDTVGVLVRYYGDHAASVHVKMLAGISEICNCRGKLLTVHYAKSNELDRLTGNANTPILQPNRVGGMILLGHFPDAIVEWLAARWPCVVVHNYTPGTNADVVEVDAIDGIGRLVRRLHNLGHRRFGFVGHAKRHGFTHARHAAFVQSLDALELDYDPSNFTRADVPKADAIGDWLQERTEAGVSAWVCDHDGLAKAVGTELVRRGFRIPEDVSLTGIDGNGTLNDGRRIASIATPFEALGSAAAHRLIRRLEYPNAARPHISIPGRVVDGETVGVAQASQEEHNHRPHASYVNQTDPTDPTDQSDLTESATPTRRRPRP